MKQNRETGVRQTPLGVQQTPDFSSSSFRVFRPIACLVYAGEVVLAIPGDKIDSSRLNLFVDRPFDNMVGFKHLERPKELEVGVLRALFELLNLPRGHAQLVIQGNESPVIDLQAMVTMRGKDANKLRFMVE